MHYPVSQPQKVGEHMFVYLASDTLPYAPHTLEQAQKGLGGLILLILAVMLFGSSNGPKAQAKAPVRRKAGNFTGIGLVIGALILIGGSHDNKDAGDSPAPKPTHSTTKDHKPSSGSTHCSLICFEPKN